MKLFKRKVATIGYFLSDVLGHHALRKSPSILSFKHFHLVYRYSGLDESEKAEKSVESESATLKKVEATQLS